MSGRHCGQSRILPSIVCKVKDSAFIERFGNLLDGCRRTLCVLFEYFGSYLWFLVYELMTAPLQVFSGMGNVVWRFACRSGLPCLGFSSRRLVLSALCFNAAIIGAKASPLTGSTTFTPEAPIAITNSARLQLGTHNEPCVDNEIFNSPLVGSLTLTHFLDLYVPTSLPTNGQPSLQPNWQPTGHPSGQATIEPSVQPSGFPSSQPTGRPSRQVDAINALGCVSGQYAVNYDCIDAPKGWYAPNGSNEPIICPANTYSLGRASSCTACTNGGVCTAGSSACVNPQTSFAAAFIGLTMCSLGVYLYIVGGRLHRMAFVRKETLIKKATKMYNLLTATLMRLNDEYKEIAAKNRERKETSVLLTFLCVLFTLLLFVAVFIVFFVGSVYSTFYTAVILYRGYFNLPNVTLPPFVDRLTFYVEYLSGYVKIPYLMYIFYPFNWIVTFFANLNINLNAARVTCIGAQLPVLLLIDCFVVGVTVLVIESDMEIFWCSAFANVHQEFHRSLLRYKFWKDKPYRNVIFLIWSIILQLLPHPRIILQFGLGFFKIYSFFDVNYHAGHSKDCNTGQYYMIDQSLAMISTVVAYLSILPMFYIFAQIVVPEFSLDIGVVKPEKHSAKRILQLQKSKCPCCTLPLSRKYSNFFNVFRCGNGSDCVSSADHKVGATLTFYACPRFTSCNWAMCRDCFHEVETKTDASADDIDCDLHDIVDENDEQVGLDSFESPVRSPSVQLKIDSEKFTKMKNKHFYSQYVTYGKSAASFAALDWFYVRHTFAFAERLRVHISEKVRDKEGISFTEKDPYLPWFTALGKGEDIYENERVEVEWAKYSAIFPSYYRMILTVFDDLMPKFRCKGVMCSTCQTEIHGRHYYCPTRESLHLCELCELSHDDPSTVMVRHPDSNTIFINAVQVFVLLYACTLIGQLHSERGRTIWNRVTYNYFVFFGMCFGLWSAGQRSDFGVDRRIKTLKKEDAVLMYPNPNYPLLTKSDEKLGGIQMLSALVSPRIVLLQMIPYVTAFSLLAVNLSQSPVLVMDAKMKKYLPPLFQGKLTELAREMLLEAAIKPHWWSINLMSIYIFTKQSRAIQFVINATQFCIAAALVFGTNISDLRNVFTFSIIFYALLALVNAIYPSVILLNILFPSKDLLTKQETMMFDNVDTAGVDVLELESFDASQTTPAAIEADDCARLHQAMIDTNNMVRC